MEDGGWKIEDGGWKNEEGGWKIEEGGWRMEVENQRFEIPLEAGMEDGGRKPRERRSRRPQAGDHEAGVAGEEFTLYAHTHTVSSHSHCLRPGSLQKFA